MRLIILAGLLFALNTVCHGAMTSPSVSTESGVRVRESLSSVPAAASVETPSSRGGAPFSSLSTQRAGDAPAAESRVLPRIRSVSGFIFITLMVIMLVLAEYDHLHPRKLHDEIPLSVIIPCYNDGDSVAETIASVFKAYPHDLIDLTVINDCSSDNSLEVIRELQGKYHFRLVDNKTNRGKAVSLNDAVSEAAHDFVLCLDADTILNRQAVHDMLARFEHDRRLGGVSCPYRPRNRGFLPAMQALEYSMLLLTQGAQNIFSAMALWGGCLMVRKEAFADCGGFNLSAITEDVDLAYRLNRRSWRVEQSFRPVRSLVPDSIPGWVRQKLRWTAGGFQCCLRHFSVWIRNPIQMFFMFSYSLFIVSSVPQFFESVDFGEDVIELWNLSQPLWQNLVNINTVFGRDIITRLGRLALCLLSAVVYVLPLIGRPREVLKVFLVIPFSLVYFPVYIVLSFFGMYRGARSILFPKKSDTSGWKTT